MKHHDGAHETKLDFYHTLEKLSKLKLADCYQCGKCSAGCPQASVMDLGPTKLIRLSQLGMKEKVMQSNTIWLCVSCETCGTRCPKEFNPAHLINAIRELAIEEDYGKGVEPNIVTFHSAFLNDVEKNGRLSEFGLVGQYKLRTGNLFEDIDLAPKMFSKGKLKLFPHKVKNIEAVKKIFNKVYKKEKHKKEAA